MQDGYRVEVTYSMSPGNIRVQTYNASLIHMALAIVERERAKPNVKRVRLLTVLETWDKLS